VSYAHLEVDFGPVTTVTLNRPDARNAMDDNTLRELADCFQTLAGDRHLRCVVVKGAGKDFCAGADIQWMKRAGKLPPAQGKKDAMLLGEMVRAVDSCPVPVIAGAQGAIFGGGLGLVAACDVAVVAEDAKMCFSECRLGILPAVISCFVVPKIGLNHARSLYFTAEVFGAEKAKEIGLVHAVVSESDLKDRVDAAVADVLRCGPNAVREAKALLKKLGPQDLDKRLKLVVDTLVRVRSSPEGQEGLAAFLEKRKPAWVK
jgi:methylglutaconyl-CoA hydratase